MTLTRSLVQIRERLSVVLLFSALVALSVWLQSGLLEPREADETALDNNDPDYYVEKFVSVGRDKFGKRYQIIADRLVHYPAGDRASLDNPHIIQYDLQGGQTHIHAESGWLHNDNGVVLLGGNVRTVQGADGSVATSDKMTIQLQDKSG